MPNAEDFRSTLEEIFSIAEITKLSGVVVKAGNLHRLVGDYPGNHRMPICCNAMRQMMKEGDEILAAPPKVDGASLEILYRL